jgi:peptide/nickel transport system substrate-binding protein
MREHFCPNCGKPFETGDEACRYCGFVFPFSTAVVSAGTILHSRYEILELIHTGGMGYVYLARDKTLFDRLCIVKQIRESIQSDTHLKKLEEEALRMSRLNHPNIAMILDHFVENGFYFLVVERIAGKTLSEVFKDNQGKLSEDQVIKWALTICDVIIYIHKEGVIHRDISPDNIMLTDDGTIKFIDFGTLREFRHVTSGGTAGMGKYGYAPPEQWQGKPEPRSDLFALAATIYYLLSGYLPLSKEYVTGHSPQRDDFYPRFPPIRTRNPAVSLQLETVLAKSLQLEPAARFASAAEMKTSLQNMGQTAPVKTKQKPKPVHTTRRRVFIFAAVIVPVMVAAAFLIPDLLNGKQTTGISTGPSAKLAAAHVPVLSYETDSDSSALPDTIYSNFTSSPPEINGITEPGEWTEPQAGKQLRYQLDNAGKTGKLTVSFMNDNENLYVAINMHIPDLKPDVMEKNSSAFRVTFLYDGNQDGAIKPGECFRMFDLTRYYPNTSDNPVILKKAFLSGNGGLSTDSKNLVPPGKGAYKYTGDLPGYVYELQIPLYSGDKDLFATPGDTIRVKVDIAQFAPYQESYSWFGETGWPRGGIIDIDSYGSVYLATENGLQVAKPATATITRPPTTIATTTSPVTTPVTTKTAAATPGASSSWWSSMGTPNYGGTFNVRVTNATNGTFDPGVWQPGEPSRYWSEGLFYNDWTTDRSISSFQTGFIPDPEYFQGLLAESWEQVSPQTIVVHLRKGVHWQNKAPVNGREFTADDVQFYYDKQLGTGNGYTQPQFSLSLYNTIERVTANDQYTVKFDFKSTSWFSIFQVMSKRDCFVPPETVRKNLLGDWKFVAGTGPWIMSDYVEGVTVSYTKNPGYWGSDERFYQNQLPYADGIKILVIPDAATGMAALRTGKIDLAAEINSNISWQMTSSLEKTNPEIRLSAWPAAGPSIGLRTDKIPFNDIRVRKALQMAIDRKAIAGSYYGGAIDGKPAGLVSPLFTGFAMPYDVWDSTLQGEYSYNPVKAKQLLAEAGYPNGFKTNIVASSTDNQEVLQVTKAFFADIGVDMQINTMEIAPYRSYLGAGKHDQMAWTSDTGIPGNPSIILTRRMTDDPMNYTHNTDAAYDELVNKVITASSMDTAKNTTVKANDTALREHWSVNLFPITVPVFWSPSVKGYSGDISPGGFELARCWSSH